MQKTAGPRIPRSGEDSIIARSNFGCGWICRIK